VVGGEGEPEPRLHRVELDIGQPGIDPQAGNCRSDPEQLPGRPLPRRHLIRTDHGRER
jgi:hypothetical protein